VVFENKDAESVVGSSDAPYLNGLAAQGAAFTDAHGVTHPSQPNYLALFSGSTQGVTDDSCPQTFSTPNLAGQLRAAGRSFTGYSEGLPAAGYTGCRTGGYARKHNPWVNFTKVPAASNLPFTRFPTDYATLPTVSFVIPNLDHDAHDGTVAQADTWLRANLDGYVQWAKTHNSLIIVTFDEDDSGNGNHIPTVFAGPMVKPGAYAERITHYSVLRTIEEMYGLPCINQATRNSDCSSTPITDVWR
jgi:acid phosphatase